MPELDGGRDVHALAVNIGQAGDRATLSIRPERIVLVADGTDAPNHLPGRVQELIYLGDHIRVRLSVCGNDDFVVKLRNDGSRQTIKVGQDIAVAWATEDCRALDPIDI